MAWEGILTFPLDLNKTAASEQKVKKQCSPKCVRNDFGKIKHQIYKYYETFIKTRPQLH